jgi:hypothetical protein
MDIAQQRKTVPAEVALRSYHHVNEFYRTVRTLIRAGAAVLAVWLGSGAIEKFAGQETSVVLSLFLNTLFELKFTVLVALTGVAAAWGALERTLRRRQVSYYQDRVRELETRIDPNSLTDSSARKRRVKSRQRGKR